MTSTRLVLSMVLSGAACARYEYRPTPCPEGGLKAITPGRVTWETTSHVGELVGVVETPSGRVPREGAAVDLPWLARRAPVLEGGTFRFEGVPAGRQLLRVRRIEHGVLLDRLVMPASGGLRATVHLVPNAAVLDGCGYGLERVRRPWWKPW